MAKQKIFFGSAIGLCLSFGLLSASSALADVKVWQDMDLAQGDGDPSEELPAEFVAETESGEDDVATITAEGDFLLPTYLLPVQEDAVSNAQSVTVAEADNQVVEHKSVAKTDQNVLDETVTTKTITTTKTTTTTEELPIYVVSTKETGKSEQPAVVKTEQKVVQTAVPVVKKEPVVVKKEVKTVKAPVTVADLPVVLASKEAQRVQLPQTQTTQTVVRTKKTTATPMWSQNKTTGTVAQASTQRVAESTVLGRGMKTQGYSASMPKQPVGQAVSVRPVLIPLAPLPKVVEPEPVAPAAPVRKVVPSAYADHMLNALEQNARPEFIMPQEIKVSFYKNATHFSGQTIKWIKAFSMSAINDPRLIVQVRLSTQTPDVQQKRLSIIRNTLIGNGLSPHQIQIVFTDRPADSLILRTINKPEHTQISVRKSQSGRRVEKRTTKW